jgi:hypothetical protein
VPPGFERFLRLIEVVSSVDEQDRGMLDCVGAIRLSRLCHRRHDLVLKGLIWQPLRVPPKFVPTLTEVVQAPVAGARPAAAPVMPPASPRPATRPIAPVQAAQSGSEAACYARSSPFPGGREPAAASACRMASRNT